MKVEILKRSIKLAGFVGDIVEADAEAGNYLATIGVVRVVEHDAPQDQLPTAVKKRRTYTPKKKGKNNDDQ